CAYCSSNAASHMRFSRTKINQAAVDQCGSRFDPHRSEGLVIGFEDVVDALKTELHDHHHKPGKGMTVVYSQLTDGFSPTIVKDRTTRRILDILIDRTEYRIRVLTKNAVVGSQQWVRYFTKHADRFVVGLSIGTLDDAFAKRLEKGTSLPGARVRALHRLQDAGVPTFGMLCPVFPSVLESDELERLIAAVRPEFCERVWSEPYNNRSNWRVVRDCFDRKSFTYDWLTRVYGEGNKLEWSQYATNLYQRIISVAKAEKWCDKLRYLLYEEGIADSHVPDFGGLEGVLLQSIDKKTGISVNPKFAELQQRAQWSIA
ncbi:MAG: hypothetical protein KDA66_17570, partial [Planctomycetaceae bacterium]|nr:hypothetical protein [Planctomycetaceae bacterium]